ncbi:hypothetical protein GLOIN_2v708231 [Rhizophagus irregularis DAOM 181602=DAOM 197198]|uniref:Endonuclease/exonuclease/phosphatase domain-containing protein n=1 Tax=Rhizophagus irregularis (strain DAOM 181602 / DAOM 197198 / MUCL 43194) TaxID=747089 RepID=A0A2P4P7Q9_RHIID|nr:hypothetical protein GLOIN_2v708231 [Rhizophagus irregularis DAOM 181602=DAOM 197198]POG61387.1 hypothetical protein GLOIN_2v708231 [Rhizophagus irregularis DAOM 181602=DAOM 197198]|eukprot:XP_025168253.1 hypothetical protein GLOIN_2v708231 [Rhizophagus irregularis DAOM 181602=DAOM 197198]
MGDFNINPHKSNSTFTNVQLDDPINSNHVTSAYYHKIILTILKNNRFKDIVKFFNDTPSYTFSNTSVNTSYIDIIFVSPNFLSHCLFGTIATEPICTDHRLIVITLNNKFFYSPNQNILNDSLNEIEMCKKNSLSYNERYNYKKITKEQWVDFKNFVWNNFQSISTRSQTHINPQKHVNIVFENIVQSIHKAINAIGFPIIKQNMHQYTYSYSIRILENDLYYIASLINRLENYFNPKTHRS